MFVILHLTKREYRICTTSSCRGTDEFREISESQCSFLSSYIHSFSVCFDALDEKKLGRAECEKVI